MGEKSKKVLCSPNLPCLHLQTGHLVHVTVGLFDANGDKVLNLGLVRPWLCNATLIHDNSKSR